ncbi:TetR/AcrR family transcriptional regulator [Roseburia hominis]
MQPKTAFTRLSEERKQELIEKAKDIYLSQPYEKITARMLLSSMGINSATFYRYFNSKDDLFLYIYDLLSKQADSQTDYDKVYTELLRVSDYLNERDARFLKLIYTVPESVVHRIYFDNKENLELYKKMVQAEKTAGLLQEDADVDLLAWMNMTGKYNALLYYRRTHDSFDENDIHNFFNYISMDLLKHGYFKK